MCATGSPGLAVARYILGGTPLPAPTDTSNSLPAPAVPYLASTTEQLQAPTAAQPSTVRGAAPAGSVVPACSTMLPGFSSTAASPSPVAPFCSKAIGPSAPALVLPS